MRGFYCQSIAMTHFFTKLTMKQHISESSVQNLNRLTCIHLVSMSWF